MKYSGLEKAKRSEAKYSEQGLEANSQHDRIGMRNEMGGGSGQDHAGPRKPSGGCGVPPEGSALGMT